MIPVGERGLACLESEEFAAVALAMQSNAEIIDSTLMEQQVAITAYNRYPWGILTTTGNTTITISSAEWNGTGTFPGTDITFASFTVTTFGLAATSTLTVGPSDPAGWYLVGGSCTFQATGAVTIHSRRDLAVEWSYPVAGVTQREYVVSSVYESNTGGDALSVSGLFFADGARSYIADFTFSHRNAGSTMQVNSGARLWLAYMGTGLEI